MPRRLTTQVTQSQSRSVRFDQDQLLRDLCQPVPPPALLHLRAEAGTQVQGVDNLNQHLLQAAEKWYPLPPRPERRPTQSTELANSAKHMLEIFRQMRQCRRTAQGILDAWKHWAHFQQAHRIHKQRSKQRVKQKREDLLEQAQISARDGNLFGMWKIVKQMAPRKRLQLNKDGHMLTPEEELQWIVQAYGDRYGVGSSESAWTYQPRALDSDVTIDATDLENVLKCLNPHKAVPRDSAPPVLLKACGSDIAHALTIDINSKWNSESPQVSQGWSDATVALLPKAHGRNRSPLDWRPIGLQDCLRKSVMTLLLRQARQALVDLIRRHPQTAYIPGRSTSTALRNVFEHCHQVREQAQGDRLTIHQRAAGQQPAQCTGGLQISMDLSAAFDLARWEHVKDAMDLAGVPLGVQDLLLVWLVQVRYVFNHRGRSGTIEPRWGLRQGCIASPLLWAAFTSLLCTTLEHKLGKDWPQKHMTLYADDSHLRWVFHSYAKFERCMDEVKIVFQVFRMSHLLKINYEKTKAILKVAGTLSSKVHQHFIRKNAQERRLLLSPGDPTTWLPLVRQAEYLGLIVSYGSFELQSLRPNNRRWALAAILHSRKIGIGYKLQIWRSCVLSTLTYGLHCCGLTGDHTLEAQRTMMRHVRAIVSNQAHLTGDTHEYIMHKYNIQTVAELLWAAHDRECKAAELHLDWMWNTPWSERVNARLRLFQEAAASAEGVDIWECPICEVSFVSSAALKTHARRAHDVHEHPQPIFNKAVHSQGGLPVCKGCGKKFSKWQSLALHINGNSCTAITSQQPKKSEGFMHMANLSTTATTQHICQMLEVSRASSVGINAFIPLKHVLPQLLQTCALCGQWCSSHRTLKRHYQYTHADLLQQLGGRVKTLVVKTATASSTCLYCQAKCKDWRGHLIKCTVAWQCAVMVLVAQDVRGERCPERVLRRGQAGVEPQMPATDGATSKDKAHVGIPAAAASRRMSDFFSKTCVKAGGGATGAKAGPLANPVHEGGDRLSAQSSLLHGYPFTGRSRRRLQRGANSFNLRARCLHWPCSGSSHLGWNRHGPTRRSSKRCNRWGGWMPTTTGNTSSGTPPFVASRRTRNANRCPTRR